MDEPAIGRALARQRIDLAVHAAVTGQCVHPARVAAAIRLSGSTWKTCNTCRYGKLNQLTGITDPANVATSFGYDRSGRQVVTADAAGRKQRGHYDLAGRLTQALDLTATGIPIRKTKYAYDRASNLTTVTNPLGTVARFDHDALGRLASQVEPVSATEWGLPESVVEPATDAHPSTSDRTWTVAYDKTGNPVRQDVPGGITRINTSWTAPARASPQPSARTTSTRTPSAH